jgi:hypothetical protein
MSEVSLNASDSVTLQGPRTLRITSLPNKELKKPILITLDRDESGFISRTVDFPLYGYSDNPDSAIENLKHEIESLYDDLMEDDNFSEEWLKYKSLLKEFIAE